MENLNLNYDIISSRKKILTKLCNTLQQYLYLNRKYDLFQSFHIWKNKTNYINLLQPFQSIQCQNKLLAKINQQTDKIIPQHQWHKIAAKKILIILYNYRNNCIKLTFQLWKRNIKTNKILLFNTFYQWNIWYSEQKLNRMNAQKFINIMKIYTVKYDNNMKSLAFERWCKFVNWYKSTIRLRLLVRLWKSYTVYIKSERKTLLPILKSWYDITKQNCLLYEERFNKIIHQSNKFTIKRVFILFKKFIALLKIVNYDKFMLLRCFKTWLSYYESLKIKELVLSPRKKSLKIYSNSLNNSNSSIFLSPVGNSLNRSAVSKTSNKSKSKPEWVNILDKDPLTHFKSSIPKHRYDCKCYTCKRKYFDE